METACPYTVTNARKTDQDWKFSTRPRPRLQRGRNFVNLREYLRARPRGLRPLSVNHPSPRSRARDSRFVSARRGLVAVRGNVPITERLLGLQLGTQAALAIPVENNLMADYPAVRW